MVRRGKLPQHAGVAPGVCHPDRLYTAGRPEACRPGRVRTLTGSGASMRSRVRNWRVAEDGTLRLLTSSARARAPESDGPLWHF